LHVTTETEHLFVHSDLGFEARQQFIATVRAAMGSADAEVELDCSTVEVVEAIDDPVIGMLVTLARAARRQGAQLVLVEAPKPMYVQMEAAGVAHFFQWKP
jgi:anti-anti-sigma regulatory factor